MALMLELALRQRSTSSEWVCGPKGYVAPRDVHARVSTAKDEHDDSQIT